MDPYIDLSGGIEPGREAEIRIIATKRDWAEPVGKVRLLTGERITECDLSLLSEHDLSTFLDVPGENLEVPLRIPPGSMRAAAFGLDGLENSCSFARFFGKDMKLTAVFNGQVVGRIFLDSRASPAMVCGDPTVAYLPQPWRKTSDNSLVLLLEGIGEAPTLDKILLEYPV
jgi:beta-galactosidase